MSSASAGVAASMAAASRASLLAIMIPSQDFPAPHDRRTNVQSGGSHGA
jgi:hypothetical protein